MNQTKQLILFILVVCSCTNLYAQTAQNPAGLVSLQDLIDPHYQNNEAFDQTYDDVEGDPYFDDWSVGDIHSKQGKKFADLELRYDVYADQLLYKNDKVIAVNENLINTFEIIVDGYKTTFKHFPYKGYMEVLHEGKTISLYKKHTKELKRGEPATGYNAGATQDKLISNDYLYYKLSAKNTLTPLPRKKKHIKAILKEIDKDILSKMKENKWNPKREDELINILEELDKK